MEMYMAITCEDVVRKLQQWGLSTPAKNIAEMMGTDSRAVATALRKATYDGRVKMAFKRGIAYYRFIKLTPNAALTGAEGVRVEGTVIREGTKC
jgi:hypothetical protein